jgi:hypothetical protein
MSFYHKANNLLRYFIGKNWSEMFMLAALQCLSGEGKKKYNAKKENNKASDSVSQNRVIPKSL